MPIALLLQNWKLIAQIAGAVALAVLLWWFLIHNPKRIEALEADKAELSRLVENGNRAIQLLTDIQTGREQNYAEVDKKVREIQSASVPRKRVLIPSGVLPTVYKPYSAPYRTKSADAPSGK